MLDAVAQPIVQGVESNPPQLAAHAEQPCRSKQQHRGSGVHVPQSRSNFRHRERERPVALKRARLRIARSLHCACLRARTRPCHRTPLWLALHGECVVRVNLTGRVSSGTALAMPDILMVAGPRGIGRGNIPDLHPFLRRVGLVVGRRVGMSIGGVSPDWHGRFRSRVIVEQPFGLPGHGQPQVRPWSASC